MLQGHRDLKIFQLAYRLAIQIYCESARFPREEKYSLTDQVRRASRSVAANIAEGYRKRRYRNMFIAKMADSDAEAAETQVWLDFANDCGYLDDEKYKQLVAGYEELGRMFGGIIRNPEKFILP